MKQQKILFIVSLIAIVAVTVTGVTMSILSSINHRNKFNPLNCCIQEIHTHENYDCEWSYTYNQVHNADKGAECYVITCYVNDRVGEWYCYFIDYQDYYYVDCDLAREWIIE